MTVFCNVMVAAFYVKKPEGARREDIGRCDVGGKGGKESWSANAGYNCINWKAAIGYKGGPRRLSQARCKQILALTPYDANEDIMTPNQVGTKADQSTPSSSNVIVTKQPRVACNGGGGPLGHPQVWLTLGIGGKVTCPYCSCIFVAAVE